MRLVDRTELLLSSLSQRCQIRGRWKATLWFGCQTSVRICSGWLFWTLELDFRIPRVHLLYPGPAQSILINEAITQLNGWCTASANAFDTSSSFNILPLKAFASRSIIFIYNGRHNRLFESTSFNGLSRASATFPYQPIHVCPRSKLLRSFRFHLTPWKSLETRRSNPS